MVIESSNCTITYGWTATELIFKWCVEKDCGWRCQHLCRSKEVGDDYVLIFYSRSLLFPHCKCLKMTRLARLCNKYWKSFVEKGENALRGRLRMILISELEELWATSKWLCRDTRVDVFAWTRGETHLGTWSETERSSLFLFDKVLLVVCLNSVVHLVFILQ